MISKNNYIGKINIYDSLKIIKYIFIIPFLLFSCGRGDDYNNLENKITNLLKSHKGSFAVALKNLDDGNTILINENEIFHAASTMKTPVMIELFKKKHNGEISFDDSLQIKNEFKSIVDGSKFELSSFDDSDENIYKNLGEYISIRELIFDMITKSSNFGTNLLIDYIDVKNVNNTMRDIGAENINVLRGVGDLKAFDKGLNNTTSAKDLLVIYEKLAMGSLINPSTSNEMVEILKNQVYKDIIPKYLPDNVKVAHKTGWISGVRHDSGIVFLENGKKYVLILLSKNLDDDIEGAEFLAKISLEIFNHLS
jgi:beta-lactamase class A|tara:strand:+ start:2498 stop:3427 length:930 start_codon:yes stop_codon:yes gene_type:complete